MVVQAAEWEGEEREREQWWGDAPAATAPLRGRSRGGEGRRPSGSASPAPRSSPTPPLPPRLLPKLYALFSFSISYPLASEDLRALKAAVSRRKKGPRNRSFLLHCSQSHQTCSVFVVPVVLSSRKQDSMSICASSQLNAVVFKKNSGLHFIGWS